MSTDSAKRAREYHKAALCHPERRHAARGMCVECYTASYPKSKRAQCHPDRLHHTHGLCRSCYEQKLRKELPGYAERHDASSRAWSELNKDRIAEASRKYQRNPRVVEARFRRARASALSRYGLTIEDEVDILGRQGGGCGICGGPSGRKQFELDHDHVTGKLRGLLCPRCNKGIGLLGDSAEGVRKALDYLTNSPARAAKEEMK